MISLTSNDNQHVNESMEHFMQKSNRWRRTYHRRNLYSHSIVEPNDVLFSKAEKPRFLFFFLHRIVAQNKLKRKSDFILYIEGMPFVALLSFRLIALTRLSFDLHSCVSKMWECYVLAFQV